MIETLTNEEIDKLKIEETFWWASYKGRKEIYDLITKVYKLGFEAGKNYQRGRGCRRQVEKKAGETPEPYDRKKTIKRLENEIDGKGD